MDAIVCHFIRNSLATNLPLNQDNIDSKCHSGAAAKFPSHQFQRHPHETGLHQKFCRTLRMAFRIDIVSVQGQIGGFGILPQFQNAISKRFCSGMKPNQITSERHFQRATKFISHPFAHEHRF